MLLSRAAVALFLLFGLSQPAASQAPTDAASRAQELRDALGDGLKAAAQGKADVPLAGQASLHLPPNYTYVPQPQAGRIMRAFGNTADPTLEGLIFPSSGPQTWFVAVNFIRSGYIKDDEAKDWKADTLLADLREGTEEANKDRIARGFEPIEVAGWAEPPAYDPQTHRLVWAATNRKKNNPNSSLGVNYNTYALGREGYFTLNLLTRADMLAGQKVHSRTLLAALEYNKGKDYRDFDASTDHVAAYGITALVAGVAAKKLGLLAVIGAFLAKGAKLLILAAGAVLYGIRRLFTGRNTPSA
jgi:uncharacterized membrane-anchored protein